MEMERKIIFDKIFENYSRVDLKTLARQLIDMDCIPSTAIAEANKVLNTMHFPNDPETGELVEGCFSMSDTLRATAVMCVYDVFDPYGAKKEVKAADGDESETVEIEDSEDLMDFSIIQPSVLGVCSKSGEILPFPIGNSDDNVLKSDDTIIYARDFYDTIMTAMLNDNVDYDAPVFVRSDTGCWRSVIDINVLEMQDVESIDWQCAVIELHLR